MTTRSDGAGEATAGPDGVIVVDKPAGPTSHDIVARGRKALRTRRVGHAGTLDPFATGVLVLCVGRATRLSGLFTASPKTYEGTIRFGFATDSGDRTGQPLGEPVDAVPDVARLGELIAGHLAGEIDQVPPMHSAKKRGGVALHELARRGEVVERAAVRVRVDAFELFPAQGSRVRFRVTCSAGTYVRVLASDLGELAGMPAHLDELRRVRSGAFGLEGALSGDALTPEAALAALIPIDAVPLPIPAATLRSDEALAFRHGRAVALPGPSDGPLAARDPEGRLLGLGTCAGGLLHPDAVMMPA